MPAASGNKNVLICGLNWIGDSIMSMPALTLFRRQFPSLDITLLVKPSVAALWPMYDRTLEILLVRPGWREMTALRRALRAGEFSRACILPRSFRSALPPWLAGIPRRAGRTGRLRSLLLTERLQPAHSSGLHQSYEYLPLLGCRVTEGPLPEPSLTPPGDERSKAHNLLRAWPYPRIGLMPGAARGPSKRWPTHKFKHMAETIVHDWGGSIILMGSATDHGSCAYIAETAPGACLNLAGRTSLPAWAAYLAECDAVVANDSGGMHLAAAVGTPVVALFGITDPSRTGPRGSPCRILQHSARRARDVPRRSTEAAEAMHAIGHEAVAQALLELLPTPPSGGSNHAA